MNGRLTMEEQLVSAPVEAPLFPTGLHAAVAGLRARPLFAAATAICAVFLLAGLFAGRLAAADAEQAVDGPNLAPSLDQPFGTDRLGRDILSRVIYATRTALVIASAAVVIGTLAGVSIGLLSGSKPGPIDFVIQRVVDLSIA